MSHHHHHQQPQQQQQQPQPPQQQNPFKRYDKPLKEFAGKRIGIEGNWFVRVVRSHLKREDPHWALNGPVSPAIGRIVDKFLARLSEHSITPVFVFDGLYTRRQAHPAVLLHNINDTTGDLKQQVRDMEPLDEDAIAYLQRLLVSMRLEVVTAPYLAWAQLAYFAYYGRDEGKPFIDEVIGSQDVLCVGPDPQQPGSTPQPAPVQRVITEIGNLDDKTTNVTVYSAESPEGALQYLLLPRKLAVSPHWSWLQHADHAEDFQHVKSTINYCPIMTFEGVVKPISTVFGQLSIAMLRQYYYNDLGAESPLMYFLLSANVVSPQLLNVVAAEQFIDDPPFIRSEQHRVTLERIIPLRTQIVFQLIQELERFLKGFERQRALKWERPHDEQNPSLPIQRPPKISLDEWDGIDPAPAQPYTFTTVLNYSNKAKAAAEHGPPSVYYTSSEQALGAVLLKALDLLGYFTHAAHTTSDAEESSMSIFAHALEASGVFAAESVLLIELTRTHSLHDGPLSLNLRAEHLPPQHAEGVNYASRIMSLLRLETGKVDDGKLQFSPDLLAFNDVARAFQRNLRLLSETIAAAQVLNHSSKFPLQDMRDFAARLPFGTPLSTHAGVMLEYMLTNPEYMALPAMYTARVEHLKAAFPYVTNMPKALMRMHKFWVACGHVICKLLEDEEAEEEFLVRGEGFLTSSHAIVQRAFSGICQIPALRPIARPPM